MQCKNFDRLAWWWEELELELPKKDGPLFLQRPHRQFHPFALSFSLILHQFLDRNKSRFFNLIEVHLMGESLHLERKILFDDSCEFQEGSILWNLWKSLIGSVTIDPMVFLSSSSCFFLSGGL